MKISNQKIGPKVKKKVQFSDNTIQNKMIGNMSRFIFLISLVVLSILSFADGNASIAADWVHPALRNQYEGYRKLDNRKKNSSDWTYATNRPQGNIHGGGTVEYGEYKPFYPSPLPKKKTAYKRPLRKESDRAGSCNCPD